MFISLGALADHGSRRKSFMMSFGYITCALGLVMLLVVNTSMWWLAYIIYIVSNIFYCASYVFYYAYVPVLSRYEPTVIEAKQSGDIQKYFKVSEQMTNIISGKGFMYSYVGSVMVLIIGAAIAFVFGNGTKYGLTSTYGLQIGIGLSCLWGIVFLVFYTQPLVKPRPGPPLPEGENYLIYSWKKVGHTLGQARKLSELFKFLIAWFIYSDGFFTISSVAILFAQAELGADQFSLLGAAIVTPLFAGIGNVFWTWLQHRFQFTTRQVLVMHVFFYSLLPLYGIFFFKHIIELFPAAAYHGFLLGATQSSCRVMFSELLPPGMESEFFGLYEITDKGSSWMGPLIVGAIRNSTGSMRNGFYFLFAFLILPGFLFYSMDMPKGRQEARDFTMKEFKEYNLESADDIDQETIA
ncbi:autophagy-related protein 22-like protein [Gorgonomyces haynaldii]|nr:autophagy-related protein 22-like protein [Gorgonomyces haynaldii]